MKIPWNFSFSCFTPGNSRQKAPTLEILQNCVRSLGIPRPKTKTPGNSTFFLVTLGNSTLFLINPWKFYMLFLWYPWKFHLLNPPVRFFSGIAHCQRRLVRNIFFPFFNIITWFNIIDIEMGNTSIYSCSHIYWKLSLHYFCHSFAKLTLWGVGTKYFATDYLDFHLITNSGGWQHKQSQILSEFHIFREAITTIIGKLITQN